MTLDVYFVIKNQCGQYLDGDDNWDSLEHAWKYTTSFVFSDAGDNLGSVFLVLPNGREIEVSKGDFRK